MTIWVQIVIALVANATTVVVLLISNAAGRARERERDLREDARLEKSRHDQRVQWARESHTRLSELRRPIYLEFYQRLRSTALAVYNAGLEEQPSMEPNWQLPAYESLLRLQIVADPETYAAASRAYSALQRWGDNGPSDWESKEQTAFDEARDSYLGAIRHDLGIELDDGRLSASDIIR